MDWLTTQAMHILVVGNKSQSFQGPKHHSTRLGLIVALTYFPSPLGKGGYLALIWVLLGGRAKG